MKSKKKMKGVDLNDYGDAGSGKHSLKIDMCQAQRHHRIVLMLLALGLQSNYKYERKLLM